MSGLVLNSMANFNEKTVSKIEFSLHKRYNMRLVPNGKLNFVQWNHNTNEIVTGGTAGAVRVVELRFPHPDEESLSTHQPLVWHGDNVTHGVWNEYHQELVTCDSLGHVLSWKNENDKYEPDFINKEPRKRDAPLAAVAWNYDSYYCAAVYQDGEVFMATKSEIMPWIRHLNSPLVTCEWSPYDTIILGTGDGDLLVFDQDSHFYAEVIMKCVSSEDNKIVCMRYFSSKLKSKHVYVEEPSAPMGENEPERIPNPRQPVAETRPVFAVTYLNGTVQLMRSVLDEDPIITKLPDIKITGASWAPNGAFLAVCGVNPDNDRHSKIYFLSAYGQLMGFFQHLNLDIRDIDWGPSGLKIVMASDSFLFVGEVRPVVKWAVLVDTIVYPFQTADLNVYKVIFYGNKAGTRHEKLVRDFEHLAGGEGNCVIINSQEGLGEVEYYCQLVNSTGSSLDYNITSVSPKFVCVNARCAVVANEDRYFIWHFELPNSEATPIKTCIYDIEVQLKEMRKGQELDAKPQIGGLCMGDNFFLISLLDGGVYRVNLGDGRITAEYPFGPVGNMKLNHDFTKLAMMNCLSAISIMQNTIAVYNFKCDTLKNVYATVPKGEIRDFMWSQDSDNTLAFIDKHKLWTLDGIDAREHCTVQGVISSFKDGIVTVVNFDRVLTSPENPWKHMTEDVRVEPEIPNAPHLPTIDELLS